MVKKKLLFVCKHNRFRSKIAEAYFNKINKNKDFIAKSAGAFRGRYPLEKPSVKIAKKFGISLKGRPKGVSTNLLIWQDITIIVADNVPPSLFSENKRHDKKTIVWNITDVYDGGKPATIRIIKKIMAKTKSLLKDLEKENGKHKRI